MNKTFAQMAVIGFFVAVPAQVPVFGKDQAPTSPAPLGNPADWVLTKDYPAEALRQKWEGDVAFTLAIDKKGRIESCTVAVSSGHQLLDTTTCSLVTQRATFSPATDRKGKPVAGTYGNRVRWAGPVEQRPIAAPRAFSYETTFILGADGKPGNCRVVRAGGATSPDQVLAKSPCAHQQQLELVRDAAGNPVARLIRYRTSVSIEPAP